MANKTIPDLTAAASLADADLFIISQGAVTKKLTGTILKTWLPNISFSVNKDSSNQAITTSTITLITWGTEDFDVGGYFASNRYTPLIAGKYQINLNALVSLTAINYSQVDIYKNTTQWLSSVKWHTASTQLLTHNLNGVVDMNGSTDYLEVKVFFTGAGVFRGETYASRFSGHYIGV